MRYATAPRPAASAPSKAEMALSAPLIWQPMQAEHIPLVVRMADIIHTDYPESEAVFAERRDLFPDGALILMKGETAMGYLISHPWIFRKPPALDTLVGKMPAAPSTYYIHDLALMPEARGGGAARGAVEIAITTARHLGTDNISLVAVGESGPFWHAMGFTTDNESGLREKLNSYDSDACYMTRSV